MAGYKCLPHLGMGMVGVVQVGKATNKGQAVAAAAKLSRTTRRALYVSRTGNVLSAQFGPDDELWIAKEMVLSIGY